MSQFNLDPRRDFGKNPIRWMALDSIRGMIQSEHEMVYTVNDYWDGPRVGVANFKGEPHYFECVFDESSDEWSTSFWLHYIEPEVFQLVMDQWKIWERWRDAYHEGKASHGSHPALPEDRARYEAITAMLETKLRIDPAKNIKAAGQFEIVGPHGQNTSMRKWTVRWREIS